MTKRRRQEKEQNKRRLPRPIGTTMMAIEGYGTQLSDILIKPRSHSKQTNKSKSPQPIDLTNKQLRQTNQQIKYYIIEQWTHGAMRLNNQLYTINQLAQYLNMDIIHIQQYMQIAMRKIGKWLGDEANMAEKARAIFFQAVNLVSENVSLSRDQVELLKVSQSGHYKPFISSTLNQALANHTTAIRPFLDLIKVLEPKQTGNMIFDNRTVNITKSQQFITTEEAIKMINANTQSMADNPSLADAYIGTQSPLPDVGARTQDLKAIGIRYDGTIKNSEDGPISIDHHQNRGGKAFEGRIEDEDDFKA